MSRAWNVNEIRKDFPIFQNNEIVYLDNSATSQKPYPVIDAVTDFYRNCNANPLRGLYDLPRQQRKNISRPGNGCASFSMPKARMKLFLPGMQRKA